MIWTLVDAVSAYALVATWRVRSGTGKSKRDILLAALYVFDLGLARDGRQEADGVVITSYLFNPYLFLPSLAFSTSSISNMLHLLSIMFAAHGQSISRRMRSIDSSYYLPTRKDFTRTLLSRGACARFPVFHLTGVTGDNALTWSAKVWSRQPETDLHRF